MSPVNIFHSTAHGALPPMDMDYWNESRSVIKIGGSSYPSEIPAYITIENLDIRSGCRGNNLKDRSAGTIIRYNWIEAGNGRLAILDNTGSIDLYHNWLNQGWVAAHGTFTGTIDPWNNLTGALPGFVDLTAKDYHLAPASCCGDNRDPWFQKRELIRRDVVFNTVIPVWQRTKTFA